MVNFQNLAANARGESRKIGNAVIIGGGGGYFLLVAKKMLKDNSLFK
jgi:hypothetical protein